MKFIFSQIKAKKNKVEKIEYNLFIFNKWNMFKKCSNNFFKCRTNFRS